MTLHTSHFFHLFPHYHGHSRLTPAVIESTRRQADVTSPSRTVPADLPVLAQYIYWSKLVRDEIAVPRQRNVEDDD